MGQSSFAGFLCIAQEPLDEYAVDAIDLEANADADLVFLRPYAFDVSWAAPSEPQDVVRPSFSRAPHVNIPTHIDLGAWNTPLIASSNPGNAGGEAPVGLLEAMVAAGLAAEIPVAGGPLYLRPSTEVTQSITAYRWKRQIKGATPLWRLWRLHGVRLASWSIGGEVGKVARFEGSGKSANFEKDSTETAQPWGETKALEWFDEANRVKLDQYGDALAFAGTFAHARYSPLVMTSAKIKFAGVTYPCSAAKLVGTNTIDTRPLELDDGTVVQEQTISDREIKLEITLKETSTAYQAVKESIRANLNGEPASAILGFEITFDDGTGSGGTSWRITGTAQFDVPTRGDENRLAAWSMVALLTPHETSRTSTNVELTFDNGDATIVRSTGDWIAEGVTVGETITPSGTAGGTNDVEFTVTAVDNDTLVVSPAPADEVGITCGFTVGPTLLGDNELEIKIFATP